MNDTTGESGKLQLQRLAPPPSVCGQVDTLRSKGDLTAAAGGGLSLDLEENKSPSLIVPVPELVIVPEYTGGKLDPQGGRAGRIADLHKIRALGMGMKQPMFLTLTIDRSAFPDGPEACYERAMPLVSRLLTERLGIDKWVRVVEPQTDSGDGWMHWHVLFDMGGTRWDVGRGRGDWSGFLACCRSFWCERWGIGKPVGVELQKARSRQGVAGYLAKYLVKPWPAIPAWVLERSMFRLVGFSSAANRWLRQGGLTPSRPPQTKQCMQSKRKRPVAKLLYRLAQSGLTCKMLDLSSPGGSPFRGRINAPLNTVIGWAGLLGVEFDVVKFEGRTRRGTRLVCLATATTEWMNEKLYELGEVERAGELFRRRLDGLRNEWWRVRMWRDYKLGLL